MAATDETAGVTVAAAVVVVDGVGVGDGVVAVYEQRSIHFLHDWRDLINEIPWRSRSG